MTKTPETKKSVEISQDSLDKLEQSIVPSINSFKVTIVNLEAIVLQNVKDKNVKFKACQYFRKHCDISLLGHLRSIKARIWKMGRDMEACHQIRKESSKT